MADKTLHITFKVDADGKNFKLLAGDVDGLKKVMQGAVKESKNLKSSFINFAALTSGIQNVQNALMGLQNSLAGVSAAYQAGEEQKTKLLTVMRERMIATDQEVASVNKLIGAQTQLGVLGGTVQRAGAQQLATFLSTSKSLETLIPAMNDLVTQQKGLTAGTQDAVGVANLMGKVMAGQTSALKRVGIVFTDAQEKVLKYGNEQERAATLAEVITANVGHMNKALAGTNAGRIQQIKNSFGAWKVQIGQIASQALPYLTTATASLMAVLNVTQVATAVKSFALWAKNVAWVTIVTKAHVIAEKTKNAIMLVSNTVTKLLAGANTALGLSEYGAAAGATTLKMALRGLMIATGIGVIVMGLTTAIEYLWNAFDKSGQKTEQVSDGLTDAQRAAKQTADTFDQTSAQTYGRLKTRYTELQNAWKSLKTEHEKTAWIKTTQSEFDEMGLKVRSVKDAEDVFVKNTKKVEEAFKKRAEAAANAAILTDLYERKLQLELNIDRRDQEAQARHTKKYKPGEIVDDNEFGQSQKSDFKKKGYITFDRNKTTELTRQTGAKGAWVYTDKGAKTLSGKWYSNSDQQKSDKKLLQQTNSDIDKVSKKVKATKDNGVYTPSSYGSGGGKTGHTGRTGHTGNTTTDKTLKEITNPVSENDYQNNLRYYEEQRAKVDMTSEAYKKWTAQINTTQAAFDKLKGDNKQEKALIDEKDLKSVKDYENNLSVLKDRQKEATSPEAYAELQKQIDETSASLDKFKEKAEKKYTPGAIESLNTFEDLDKAINYYQEQQNKQTAQEIENTQKTIDALEEKKKAMQIGVELPSMQKEIDEINSLSGKEFRIKVRSIGFDALTDKIKDLQKRLNDTKNPVTDSQRKEIEGMISTYSQWRKESVKSFDTVKDGWSGIKGIGDSVTSITNAINGNGDAWQTLTGVIDGVIQAYESIRTVIGIIDMLTKATQAHTAAKTAETTATTTNTAASAGNASMKATETAASLTNTSAKSGEAIANATESGAKLPFPYNLIAIAAGVAAVVGALAMIGSFSTGGIVGGGSPSGDKLLARVNSGEMILNKRQQQRLLSILSGKSFGLGVSQKLVTPNVGASVNVDSGRLQAMLQPYNAGIGGKVQFEIQGRKLVGVISNDTRISSKSGRRTNIKG